jgi:hypothetical protein
MDDVEQLIVNQLRRTDRAIEKRQKALAQVVDAPVKGRTFNRRYVTEFSFDSSNYNNDVFEARRFDVPPQTRSFIVDRDCKRFFCQEVVATILLVGSLFPTGNTPVPSAQKFSLCPLNAWRSMPFDWTVRDTSTDREWSDTALPSVYVLQGLVGGYRLPSWAVLEPGTETQVTIAPKFVANQVPGLIAYVAKVEVSFSFVGFEVL